MNPPDARRRLIRHGILLFVLGLLAGLLLSLFAAAFTTPRLGLAAPLEGVLNGTFLVALGLAWGEVGLSPRAGRAAFRFALYGTYANFGATFLAAVFGTSGLTPMAGAGHSGASWQEGLVSAGLVTSGAAILVAALMVLWGLRGLRPLPLPPGEGRGEGAANT